MSVIAKALAALFGTRPDEHRLLFLGLDASGRTTALYMMKLGQVVTTIPTIGFNVETVKHRGTEITAWDVGGCDKIRPLWRHYFQNTQAVLFFVDCNDRDRVNEAREELLRIAEEGELCNSTIAVVASKQDLPNAMSVAEVRAALRLDELEQKRQAPVGCLGTTCCDKQTYFNALDWVHEELQRRKGRAPPAAKDGDAASGGGSGGAKGEEGKKARAPAAGGPGPEDIEELLQRWLETEDEPDDEFLSALAGFTLDKWDHRTHLRIAWLLLTRHGRREGMSRIFSSIKAFIDNSPRTKRGSGRGTTFHETMTYFWAHMVHYGMVATNNPKGDFKTFLLLNPQLANGGLFLHYYTKKLMLETAESRQQVALPDKRPLPSILSDVSAGAKTSTPSLAPPPKGRDDGDDAFLAHFQAKSLDCWGHQALLRVIHCYLLRLGRRRAVDAICEGLKALQKDGFNLTLTYFWIQMVTLALTPEHRALLFPPNDAPAPPALTNSTPAATSKQPTAATTSQPTTDTGDDDAAPLLLAVQMGMAALSPADPKGQAGGTDTADYSFTTAGGSLVSEGSGVVVTHADAVESAVGRGEQCAPAGDSKAPEPSKAAPLGAAVAVAPAHSLPELPQFPALLANKSSQAGKALRKLISEPQLYLKHYSKDVIYSDAAAQAFVPPDKKPLPNIL